MLGFGAFRLAAGTAKYRFKALMNGTIIVSNAVFPYLMHQFTSQHNSLSRPNTITVLADVHITSAATSGSNASKVFIPDAASEVVRDNSRTKRCLTSVF